MEDLEYKCADRLIRHNLVLNEISTEAKQKNSHWKDKIYKIKEDHEQKEM